VCQPVQGRPRRDGIALRPDVICQPALDERLDLLGYARIAPVAGRDGVVGLGAPWLAATEWFEPHDRSVAAPFDDAQGRMTLRIGFFAPASRVALAAMVPVTGRSRSGRTLRREEHRR
jgi:hypothetical protein